VEITKKLSEKEKVKRILIANINFPLYTCPYKKSRKECKCECYKFFAWWERLRFIINFRTCPCYVLRQDIVRDRTWKWIHSPD